MGRGRRPVKPGEEEKKPAEDNRNLFQKAYSLATAIAFGTKVSPERIKKRLDVCEACEHVKIEKGHPRCGICKCKLGDNVTPQLFSLTTYEETGEYGCHHPEGSQWKKAGV